MERIWRLLVAIFFLCAGLTLLVLALAVESGGLATASIYGALVFIPIGLIKGLYDVIKFSWEENKQDE